MKSKKKNIYLLNCSQNSSNPKFTLFITKTKIQLLMKKKMIFRYSIYTIYILRIFVKYTNTKWSLLDILRWGEYR